MPGRAAPVSPRRVRPPCARYQAGTSIASTRRAIRTDYTMRPSLLRGWAPGRPRQVSLPTTSRLPGWISPLPCCHSPVWPPRATSTASRTSCQAVGDHQFPPDDAVYFAPISSSGVGAWTSTTTYPSDAQDLPCAISGGYVYCVGGTTNYSFPGHTTVPGYTNAVYYAQVQHRVRSVHGSAPPAILSR